MNQIPNFLRRGWAENIERSIDKHHPNYILANRMKILREEYYISLLTSFACAILYISNKGTIFEYPFLLGTIITMSSTRIRFDELRKLATQFDSINTSNSTYS